MSYKNFNETLTFKAAAPLQQFKIVELTAVAHEVDLGAANEGYGVVQNEPLLGEAATVIVAGVTKVKVGAAVVVGDFITSAATGFAVSTDSGDATSRRVFGRCLSAAASGGFSTIQIDKQIVSSGSAL
ncbi:MAG: capsid cement protein [Nitrospiraceae bacterium]